MRVFGQLYNRTSTDPAINKRYERYFNKMPKFTYAHTTKKAAGQAVAENESTSISLAFQVNCIAIRNARHPHPHPRTCLKRPTAGHIQGVERGFGAGSGRRHHPHGRQGVWPPRTRLRRGVLCSQRKGVQDHGRGAAGRQAGLDWSFSERNKIRPRKKTVFIHVEALNAGLITARSTGPAGQHTPPPPPSPRKSPTSQRGPSRSLSLSFCASRPHR